MSEWLLPATTSIDLPIARAILRFLSWRVQNSRGENSLFKFEIRISFLVKSGFLAGCAGITREHVG
jgi:hypothetical protein